MTRYKTLDAALAAMAEDARRCNLLRRRRERLSESEYECIAGDYEHLHKHDRFQDAIDLGILHH